MVGGVAEKIRNQALRSPLEFHFGRWGWTRPPPLGVGGLPGLEGVKGFQTP